MRTAFSHVLPLLLATTTVAQTPVFRAPEQVTDGPASYQLSRNPNGCLVMGSARTLDLVYWSGGETTSPTSPSYVLHRRWTPLTGWSAETSVADSFIGPDYIGGRQPSAALGPDGTLWVAWHDHRHSTVGSPGNSNDNIEIYIDRLPVGGAFSSTDTRITNTSAGTLGDNGYLPRLAASNGGVLSVAWYDFSFNVTVSDLFLRRSDGSGTFPAIAGLSTFRLTDATTRSSTPSYTVPDLAVDPTGANHIVWSTGTGGPAPLLYAEVSGTIGAVTPVQLAAATGGFFDPARITTSDVGDVWVVYTNDPAGSSDIRAVRRRVGQATFDSPIALVSGAALQNAPDLEVGFDGKLHAVWVDERDGRKVYYGRFTDSGALEYEVAITGAGNWQRPTIQLDSEDAPFVAMELSGATSSLWFTYPQDALAARDWELWR